MNETNYNKCKQIGAPRPGCYLVCPIENKESCIYYRCSNELFSELVLKIKNQIMKGDSNEE